MTDTVNTYIFLIVTRQRPSYNYPYLRKFLQISNVVKVYIIDHRYFTRDPLSYLQFLSMGRQEKTTGPAMKQRMATERWLTKPGKMRMQPPADHTEENLPFSAADSPPLDCDSVAEDQSCAYDAEELVDEWSWPLQEVFNNLTSIIDRKTQTKQHVQPPAEENPLIPAIDPSPLDCDGVVEDRSCNFPYDAEQQPLTAIGSPTPDEEWSYDANDSVLTMDNDLPCSCDTPSLQTPETLVVQWQKEWGSEGKWNEAFDDKLRHARTKGEHTTFLDQCTQHVTDGRNLLESICDVVHTHCPCCRERLKYDTILLYDLLVCVMSQVKFFEVKLHTGCN
ncbi:hypothetical protein BDR03DRAFT_1008439 [Suillus americanus]|nr:hypothetical protein BDR03DRAFT_1008439 [Suillus americanus]